MKGVPLVWIVFSNVTVLQRLARRRGVFARDNALIAGLNRTAVKVIIPSKLYSGLSVCSTENVSDSKQPQSVYGTLCACISFCLAVIHNLAQ